MIERSVEILLVEDNPNDVELTLHAFKKHNLTNKIHVVRDGAEALDFLFGTGESAGRVPAHAPRVILLDLKLPKVDGLEVLKKIKSDPRTKAIPVVVLTSSRRRATWWRAMSWASTATSASRWILNSSRSPCAPSACTGCCLTNHS